MGVCEGPSSALGADCSGAAAAAQAEAQAKAEEDPLYLFAQDPLLGLREDYDVNLPCVAAPIEALWTRLPSACR
jgi:hypothetical protein